MTEEKPKSAGTAAAGGLDYSGRPFGYMMPDSETAMIFEQDSIIRDLIAGQLKKMGFLTVQPATDREALKQMRFHVFNMIIIDEDSDAGMSSVNLILHFLENLNMTIRRQSFIVLISAKLSTMDNLAAYHKSVNLIINKRDIGEVEKILRRAMAEHEDFYRVFKEKIRR